MKSLGRALIALFSLFALGATAYGIRLAVQSPLFVVRVVEVLGGDPQAVSELAAIPVGRESLFELNLDEIERRVLRDPWIRSVRITKRFPQTLSIEVTPKEPQAIFQASDGALSYVDTDGRPFGKVDLSSAQDLPFLTGFDAGQTSRLQGALRLIEQWKAAPAPASMELTSLTWEAERGFRGLVAYGLGKPGTARAKAFVDFGQEVDTESSTQFQRILRVLRYLSDNSIAARQIWADSGKKIVVKTAHGS